MKTTYSEFDNPNERDYVLEGRRLTITGRKALGSFSVDVDLADVAPGVTRVRMFHPGLKAIKAYFVIIAVGIWLAYGMRVPGTWLTIASAILVLTGLFGLNRTYRPFDVVQFKTHAGGIAFDITRESNRAAEFEEFLESLRLAVLEAQQREGPNKSPEPTPTSVTPPANESKAK